MFVTNSRWCVSVLSLAGPFVLGSCYFGECKKSPLEDPLCLDQGDPPPPPPADTPVIAPVQGRERASGTGLGDIILVREDDEVVGQVTERVDRNDDGRDDECWFQASDAPEIWHRRDFAVRLPGPPLCFGHPVVDIRVLWHDPELEDRYRDRCIAPAEIYRGLPALFSYTIRGNNPGYHVGKLTIENARTEEVVGGDEVAYTLGAGDAAPPEKLGYLNRRTLTPDEVGAYLHELIAANIVNIGVGGACLITGQCYFAPTAFLDILESAVELSPSLTREEKDARKILINDIRFGYGVLGVYSAIGKIDYARIEKYASTLGPTGSFDRLIRTLRANAEPIFNVGAGAYGAVNTVTRMPPERLAFAVEARLDHCPPGTCCDPGERTVLDDLYLIALGRANPCRNGSAVCGNDGNTLIRCEDGFIIRESCRNCDCDGSELRRCSCESPPPPPPTDRDGDGVSVDEGDCDDADARQYPGAVEVCDGVDNDCDGEVDGFFEIGVIWCDECGGRVSYPRCMDGREHICVPPRDCGGGAREVCDGRDNDGDGWVDEDLGTTTCGIGRCARVVNNCSGGRWQSCAPGSPSPETCNGLDDDCDGAVDNGVCAAPPPPPPPPARESCNGLDDDGDGLADEDFVCVQFTTGPCITECGSIGRRTCQADCRWGAACATLAEECNGLDDDCDGSVDEGCGGGGGCIHEPPWTGCECRPVYAQNTRCVDGRYYEGCNQGDWRRDHDCREYWECPGSGICIFYLDYAQCACP